MEPSERTKAMRATLEWPHPVATIKMLATAATGHRPDIGDNAKVNL